VIAAAGIDTRGVTIVPGRLDTRTFYAYYTLEERVDTDPAAHFARLGHPLPVELHDYATSTEGQDDRERFGPLAVRPEEVPVEYCAARGVHLAPYDFVVHRTLPAWLRDRGVRYVTADPSIRYMQPEFAADVHAIVGTLDAFLPSELEVRAYFSTSVPDLWGAAEAFGAMGTSCVVLKLGARGQYVYETAGGRKWHVPAYPASVVDVTGAGDAFCGGFLIGLSQTADPLEAALRGNVSASLVIEGIGALYALECPPQEAERRLAELRGAVRPV
jgi:ribokinase